MKSNLKASNKFRIKEILLLTFSIIVCLVLIEFLLYFFYPAPSFLKITIRSYGAEYLLSPNRKLIYVPKPNTGEYNSYGYRGEEYSFNRSNKKKRILFIGDSVVEGYRVPIEKRFTNILSNRFNKNFEIINVAVRGYNLQQEVEYFKTFGLKFQPDLVFWGITYNDLILHSGEIYNLSKMMKHNDRNSFYIKYYMARESLESILMKSNIYRHIIYLISSHSNENFHQSIDYELKPYKVMELLKQVKQFSKEKKFRLCFIFLPVNTNYLSHHILALKNFIKSANIDIIELDKQINTNPEQYIKKSLFFRNDPCHLNEMGHKVVADLLHVQINKILQDNRTLIIPTEKANE
jgi:lysophospholipase L1-like esterase